MATQEKEKSIIVAIKKKIENDRARLFLFDEVRELDRWSVGL